jgi:hypothetical protein
MARRGVLGDTYLTGLGFNQSATTGTSFAYFGGRYEKSDGTSVTVNDGTVAISSGTNYVELNYDTGAITSNQSGFTAGRKKLWQVISDGTRASVITDYRARATQPGASGSTGLVRTSQTLDTGITTYPAAVYYDTAQSKWKKSAAGSTNVVGIATAASTVQLGGIVTGLTGFTPGSQYYLSASTAGAIDTTSTSGIKVGEALSSSTFIVHIQGAVYSG